jgi:hypothetical protein
VYRERASGRYKVQPCALDETTGAQPHSGKAVLVDPSASPGALARAVLGLLPRSMEPLDEKELVIQSAEERRLWISEHDSVLVEQPADDELRVVPLLNAGRAYVGGRSIKVSAGMGNATLRQLSEALEVAFRRASSRRGTRS